MPPLARSAARAAALAGLVAAAVFLQIRIDRQRMERALLIWDVTSENSQEARYLARERASLYLPEADFLRYASCGYGNVVADAVWLKAAHYTSKQFHGGGRLEWLGKMYGVTTDLDPQWENAYWIGAMMLAAVAKNPEAALKLLQKGMAHIPGSYKLPYEAGVTHLFLKGAEHERAAVRYFGVARQRPGCPATVKLVIDRLLAETGQLERAISEAERRVTEFGPSTMLGRTARRSLREYRSRLVLGELNKRPAELRSAVERFTRERGRAPATLAELAAAGFRVPQADAYGRSLLINPATGEVESEGLNILRLNEQVAVLNALALDARARLHRPPADEAEFLEGVRHRYGRMAGEDRLPDQIEGVMGRSLDMPVAPFGESYRYDPAKGEFAIDPARTLRKLYPEDEL